MTARSGAAAVRPDPAPPPIGARSAAPASPGLVGPPARRRVSARSDARDPDRRRAAAAAAGAPGPSGRGRAGAASDRPGERPTSKAKGLGGDQVEGRQAVRELLVAGRRRVKEVLISSDLEPAPILDDIVELATDRRVTVRQIGRGRFDALSATQASQGVMARAQSLPEHDLDELARRRRPTPAFLVALDGVTDPGNLGAVLRSAEGAGVTGVVLPRHRAVHVTPTVTKSAAGAIEYLPMCLVGGLPTALRRLEELGVWVVGLDADAERPLQDLPVHDEAVCLVLGAEGRGLSRLVRERCGALASIPLAGQLNSLNVGAAAAVACFDVARRRAGAATP